MTEPKKRPGRPPAAKKTEIVKTAKVDPHVKVYVALKNIVVGDKNYKIGDIVPEANGWLRVESWVRSRWIKEVSNAEVVSNTEL
jgi:hypothetical protein